jgi:16S rRNA (guanine966-N2)-methyltransferase
MRIITGKYRGRRLKGPKGSSLRPTGDRLRETLFDILGASVEGAVVLDAFAGTGAVGIEALSRGAREVVFIESDTEACRLIQQNLAICGISGGFRLVQRDAFPALRLLGREGFSANVSFLDPPYEWEPYGDLLDIIFRMGIARDESRCIIEHHSKATIPEAGQGYRRTRIVCQSDKCLSFFGPDSQEPSAVLLQS